MRGKDVPERSLFLDQSKGTEDQKEEQEMHLVDTHREY